MYSIANYGEMIADRVRMDAYAAALARVVTPGCVVLDIGTGTGIMAMLAVRHGARHVYAIEPNNAIQAAREVALANGLADRITFIQDLSTSVNLPELVNVMVSDLRGILPFHGNHIPTIIDARSRMLMSGGIQIPQRDTLMVAVASLPGPYRTGYDEPWIDNAYGLDLSPARPLVINAWTKQHYEPENMVVPPLPWAELDYAAILSPDVAGSVAWIVEEPAVAHGLGVWFDTVLCDTIGFSNAPTSPKAIYGAAFFPWPNAVSLDPCDEVIVDLAANLIGDNYIWRWNTRIRGAGTDFASEAVPKAHFMQSTLFGSSLSPVALRKQAADFQPTLNENGEIERLILSMCDGKTSLDIIALAMVERFPDKFSSWTAALRQVAAVSLQFGQ